MDLDLHVHTTHSSDGRMSVKEALRRAKDVGLGGIAITDHNSIAGQREAMKLGESMGMIVIPGVEVSTADGHLLALGVKEVPPRGLPYERSMEVVYEMGGLPVVAHPGRIWSGIPLSMLKEIPATHLEVINGRSTPWKNRRAQQMAEIRGAVGVGGSDAHGPDEVGRARTVVDGDNWEDILESIRKGRCQAVGRGASPSIMIRSAVASVRFYVKRGLKRI